MTETKDITTIVDAIQDKKGKKICIIDLKDIEYSPTQEFIICEGRTPTQTVAIAESIIDKLREISAIKPATVEGMRNGQWIIIDYGDMMVHVFTPETREFYNIEDLWSDGKTEFIADLD